MEENICPPVKKINIIYVTFIICTYIRLSSRLMNTRIFSLFKQVDFLQELVNMYRYVFFLFSVSLKLQKTVLVKYMLLFIDQSRSMLSHHAIYIFCELLAHFIDHIFSHNNNQQSKKKKLHFLFVMITYLYANSCLRVYIYYK